MTKELKKFKINFISYSLDSGQYFLPFQQSLAFFTLVLLSSSSAFHSHPGLVILIESEKMVIYIKYLTRKTNYYFYHFTVFHIHLTGVVRRTAFISMLHLFILFCTASLGCFCIIVFIHVGAGVILHRVAAASIRSLLLSVKQV